jgi:isopenicillin N synthase-like dioxygenase
MSESALPVVDLGAWGGGAARRNAVASALHAACRDVGFLYVKNHGVPEPLRREVFAAAHRFFALPAAEKRLVHFERSGRQRGYIPPRAEATDPLAPADLKEAFDVGLVLDAPPGAPGHARMTSPNLWPALPAFREAVEAYFQEMLDLARRLFSAFAVALGLPLDHFAKELDRPIAQMRLLRYPARPYREPAPGIGAHCDYECLTILAQDAVGGLEIRNAAGEWIAAPPLEGTLVVNVGEMLQRWTNDVYRATPHRVRGAANVERFSVPFFFATNYDTEIACLPTCVGPERPARYARIAAGRFLEQRLREIYG